MEPARAVKEYKDQIKALEGTSKNTFHSMRQVST
jgi:hypothetical protein